jgi:uncharacterized protein YndB with AHSA1/START domain
MTTQTTTLAKANKKDDRQIVVERVFNAPREKVWRAFSDPKLLAQWWGRGNRLDIERFEFERGGHWRFVEHSPENGGGTDGFEGRFREITPMDLIEQTFEWDGMPGHASVDTAVFEDAGDGRTKVTSTSLFLTAEERDGMFGMMFGMDGKGGLHDSYAALDRLLETLK